MNISYFLVFFFGVGGFKNKILINLGNQSKLDFPCMRHWHDLQLIIYYETIWAVLSKNIVLRRTDLLGKFSVIVAKEDACSCTSSSTHQAPLGKTKGLLKMERIRSIQLIRLNSYMTRETKIFDSCFPCQHIHSPEMLPGKVLMSEFFFYKIVK